MKKCHRCGKEYPETEFTKRKATSDGLSTRCKNCEKEVRLLNSEKRNQQQKEYYQKHKEHYSEYSKQYQKDHAEEIKQYCIANKERRSKNYKQWYESHKEEKLAYDEKYRKQQNELHKNDFVTKVCENCHKEFQLPYRERQTKYCSYECYYESYITKVKKTNNKKYGVDFAMQSPEIQARYIETCRQKYGVDYTCLLPQCRERNYNVISKINQDFAKFLSNFEIEVEFEFAIANYAYDFRIKNTNILIEINPTFTHTCFDTGIFTPKPPEYHLNKTQIALDNGYRCINVWDWDDWNKIINLIKPKQKLYARKLKLEEISKQLANEFIDKYHLQNACYGNSVNLGLYQDANLVQVMTFGKPRYNKNYEWELLRLCSHSDYYVVGGAEKLFRHFLANYTPESIISYCDISKFTGEVYEKLGFKLLRQTASQKIWGKYSDYITDNLLRQQGADRLIGTNDGKGTSNEEIMLREGWLPIYDCGQKVFIWEV